MSIASSISTSFRDTKLLRSLVIPALVAGTAIAIAFVSAILIGQENDIDGVNGFVEFLSGNSSSFLGGLVGDCLSLSKGQACRTTSGADSDNPPLQPTGAALRKSIFPQ